MESLFKRWTLASKQAALGTHGATADNQNEQQDERQYQEEVEQQEATTTGAEWICIEEPVGFFFPEMKKQRQLLELDQVRHVIHYASYKRVMRIHDISLVTSVEEAGTDGRRHWWMSIQDPRMLQVWIVHFPSLLRLRLWVDLLRSVVHATGSHALVGDVVLASELDRRHRRLSVVVAATATSNCTKLEDRDAEPEMQEADHCKIAIFVP